LRAQSATITVNYLAGGTQDTFSNDCYTWPTDAKTSFNYATSIWESLINSSVPIKIDACWAELAPGVLGQAAADGYYRRGASFTNAPEPDTWYAVAPANALQGTDLNGTDPEMHISYNRVYNWYYGTDGQTPIDKFDFASVVLHEICHGLGFAGSMTKSASLGYWAWGSSPPLDDPAIYDRFAEQGGGGSGTSLLSYGNGTLALGSALTSQDVFFDGANANAANGDTPPELYTPSTWASGSSYSHLDEGYNSTQNALMTYSISPGESEHSPGPIALGMLEDMGWTIGDVDLRIVKQAANGGLGYEPGDPITFTLSVENIGGATATGVVVTDTLSSDILTPTFETSLSSITATGVVSYVWELPDMASDASGVITIYGTISHTMPITNLAIWNTASISTDDTEESTNNNSSTALVGGHRVYLPLILNNYE